VIALRYEHPTNGQYNETVAVLPGERRVVVNTQYRAVLPVGGHIPTVGALFDAHRTGCPQLIVMGGRCTCAANADIMASAGDLVAEARPHGKFGAAPRAVPLEVPATVPPTAIGWCDRCDSYCYGDCTASEA